MLNGSISKNPSNFRVEPCCDDSKLAIDCYAIDADTIGLKLQVREFFSNSNGPDEDAEYVPLKFCPSCGTPTQESVCEKTVKQEQRVVRVVESPVLKTVEVNRVRYNIVANFDENGKQIGWEHSEYA